MSEKALVHNRALKFVVRKHKFSSTSILIWRGFCVDSVDMEIISYVDADSVRSYSRRRANPRVITADGKIHTAPKKWHQTRFNLETSIEKKGILSRAVAKVRFARLDEIKLALLFAVMSVLVPYATFRVVRSVEDFAHPVAFDAHSQMELEMLDTAMTKFAMSHLEANIDENGNVLTDDGEVLSASSLGIGQTVSFTTYKVQAGDTISTIAVRFGLTNISTLIAVNNIDNVRTLRAGQKLRIPSMDGLVHTVAAGDSLNGISAKYGVSMEELLDANDITDPTLQTGQEIFIPGARMDATSLKKAMGELFAYPIKAAWRLTSRFGRRSDPFTGVTSSHTGIDMACPTGTPVYASMSGKVIVAGWNNIFGNYVIVDHENGYQTLYGHMSKILTSSGKRITQGVKIGLVGSTGYSTGPHLHFTVYKNGKLVDPQSVLK